MTDGPQPLLAVSRTFNSTADGTYGQAVPAVSAGTDGTVEILHLDGGSGWRSNVGLCEMSGREVILRLELYDGAGSHLGRSEVVRLAPFELIQLNRIHERLEAPAVENSRLEIRQDAGEGTFFAYGSVVDGRTGDAMFVPGTPVTVSR